MACGGGGGGGGGTTAVAAPVATSLTASSAAPAYGATFTLTPVYSAGTGTIDNSVVCPATGVASAAITANWTTKTFTLTVTNSAGATATTTAVVTPTVVAVGAISPAAPTVTVSHTQAFTATVTGGVTNTVTWSSGGIGTWSGNTWTAPATAQSVTITATSVDDNTKKATTTVTVAAAVVAPPVATSLTASSATPAYGGTFTLTPVYSAGTGTIDNSVVCPATGVASAAITANWAGAKTFTLTVTNAANVTATKSVTVTPQVVSVGAVSPAAPTVSVSASQAFTATVTGGALNTVTWSSGGVGTWAGNTWTAPATAQSVTIKATSVDDPTKTATTIATVVAAPAITSFTAGAATITNGSGTTLSYAFTGGTGTINTVSGTVTSGGTSNVSPTTTTTYTLTVTNGVSAPATRTVTVTVVPAPTITLNSFTNSGPIASGATATLNATFNAGPGGTAVVTGGVSPLTMTSGTPLTTGILNANTTYTLTVSNAATTPATATATTTVTVGNSLVVNITGLVSPLLGSVTVTGPNSYSQVLAGTATQTLSGLADGTYTITPATVTDTTQPGLGGTLGPAHLQRYPAVLSLTQTLALVGANTATVTVIYPAATLSVAIPGTSTISGTATSIDLVLMPPGNFTMGEQETIMGSLTSSLPAHTVTVGKAFYMAKVPCTQAQWLAIMNNNPSAFCTANAGPDDDLTRPVESVSVADIATSVPSTYTCFLDQLNTAASTRPASSSFRLPTEVEYEYACRAGTSGDSNFFFGTFHNDSSYTGEPNADLYGWFADNSAVHPTYPSGVTHSVGKLLPNAWGLYDMAGNVWEACIDSWHDSYDVTSENLGSGVTPLAPTTDIAWLDIAPAPASIMHPYRSGSWNQDVHLAQSKYRGPYPTTETFGDQRNPDAGFRVVLQLP
jgi:formylglycine-generating enzyme required for sulfatase activity